MLGRVEGRRSETLAIHEGAKTCCAIDRRVLLGVVPYHALDLGVWIGSCGVKDGAMDGVTHSVVGQSLDGRDLDLLTVGDGSGAKIWVIAQ